MKSGAFSEISQRRHRRKGPVAAALYFYHGLLARPGMALVFQALQKRVEFRNHFRVLINQVVLFSDIIFQIVQLLGFRLLIGKYRQGCIRGGYVFPVT